jgi:hypothetical protein
MGDENRQVLSSFWCLDNALVGVAIEIVATR